MVTFHVNTRGCKKPLDRRTAFAVAALLTKAYEQHAGRSRQTHATAGGPPAERIAMATKQKRKRRRSENPGTGNRIIVYSSGKGWRWRGVASNGKKVSNGGEWYRKLPRAIGAAYLFGPRSFKMFVKTSTNGQLRAVSEAEAQREAAKK